MHKFKNLYYMSFIDFPLLYLKKECQSLLYAYVAGFLGSAGRPQKRELPVPQSSRILTLLSLFKHHLSQKQAYETDEKLCIYHLPATMHLPAFTCFGLEAFPYRTSFVQKCCTLCLKNILEVFVFHFKTS